MLALFDIKTAITAVVFALMVVVGTDCSFSGLKDALRRPGLVATVTLGQFLLVPVAMLGCCHLAGVPPRVTGSLLLITCCPAGSISNMYCYLTRGNTSLSVALTIFSNLAALALTPVALLAVRGMSDVGHSGLPLIPALPLLKALTLTMLVPLLLGIAIRAWWPDRVLTHQRQLRLASLSLIVLLLALIISAAPDAVTGHILDLLLVATTVTLVLLAAGWVVARAFRLPGPDRLAVLFELPCRNLAVAAVVGLTVLGRPDLVPFAAALFVIQAALLLALVLASRALHRVGYSVT